VRSAYCSRGIGREPNIRLANSCGSLAKLDELDKVKTHLDNFKEREKERHKADKRRKRQEQRVVDLLTVKGFVQEGFSRIRFFTKSGSVLQRGDFTRRRARRPHGTIPVSALF